MSRGRSSRGCAARILIGCGAAGVPLFAASVANAAIAGAAPASTTGLPDLISAVATGQSSMSVCYDKPLAASSAVLNSADDLYVSDYLSGTTVTQNPLYPVTVTLAGASAPDCVNLQFNPLSGQLSLGQGTVVTSVSQAVTAASGGGQSLADSTTLTSGTSHTGVDGVTAGPGLSSTAVYTGSAPGYTNALVYTFNQTVDPNNVAVGGFFFESTDGSTTTYDVGTAAMISGNTVTVQFGASGADAVQGALQTGARFGVVFSAVDGDSRDEVGNDYDNVPLTGAGTGTVTVPTLISAALNANDTAVTFTYDHEINTTASTNNLGVVLSDGAAISGSAYSYSVSGNSVTVTYGAALQDVAEYAVQAGDDGAGVALSGVTPGRDFQSDDQASPAGRGEALRSYAAPAPAPAAAANATDFTSTPASVPIGGNAGAFARGFTTGADVESAVSTGTGAVQVTVDQRVATFDLGDIDLLNAAGQVVDVAQSEEASAAPAPGAEVIDLQFSPTVTTGTQIQFNSGALLTALNADTSVASGDGIGAQDNDGINVPQIVSVSGGSAARVRAARSRKPARGHPRGRAARQS